MKAIIEHYELGHAPPPPGNVKGHVLVSRMLADGKTSYRLVHLTFGPEGKLGFNISIFLPAETNGIHAPFPVIVQPAFSAISDGPMTNTASKKSSSSHNTLRPKKQSGNMPRR